MLNLETGPVQHEFPIRPRRTVLVAGGAGFIGSHLCAVLAAHGDSIVCLDNLHTGRRENIGPLAASANFTFVEHDVVEPLPEGLPKFDEIYNLACPASPPRYQADPLKTAMTCALGTMNLLQRAERDGARLLQASTSEVYGDPEMHPQRESYWGRVNPVGPRSCYDEGKRFAETVCTDFAARRGVTVKIARIFNTYGPRMQADDGRVVSNFVLQALNDEDLTVYGAGEQTRSFCYVDDLVGGLTRLMNSNAEVYGPVNLGNPVEITVGEFARLIIEMTGSGSRIVHLPLPTDDPTRRRPDIGRAESLLNWSPRIDLRQGLAATIRYFAEERADLAAA